MTAVESHPSLETSSTTSSPGGGGDGASNSAASTPLSSQPPSILNEQQHQPHPARSSTSLNRTYPSSLSSRGSGPDTHQPALHDTLPLASRPFSKWEVPWSSSSSSSSTGALGSGVVNAFPGQPAPAIARNADITSSTRFPPPPSSPPGPLPRGLPSGTPQTSLSRTPSQRPGFSSALLWPQKGRSGGSQPQDSWDKRPTTPGRSASAPLVKAGSNSPSTKADSAGSNKPRVWRVPTDVPEVKDMEVMMGETLKWEILGGGSSSFSKLGPEELPPRRVLEIGCGMGLWCVEMAQEWTESEFVGLDISRNAPLDLDALARLQIETGGAYDEGGIDWEDLSHRVSWVEADFLELLPFDSGCFDLVRIGFLNLGIPEPSWTHVLDEAARVLEKGTGILEIVDMSNSLPPMPLTPPSSPKFGDLTLAGSGPSSTAIQTASNAARIAAQSALHPFKTDFSQSPPSGPRHRASGSLSVIPPEPSQRKRFEEHLARNRIQPTVSVVIRPALLLNGMGKMTEVLSERWVRPPLSGTQSSSSESKASAADSTSRTAPGVFGDVMGVWTEAMFPPPSPSTLSSVAADARATAERFAESLGYADRVSSPLSPDTSVARGGKHHLRRKLVGSSLSSPSTGRSKTSTDNPNPTARGIVEAWAWTGRKAGRSSRRDAGNLPYFLS